MKPLKVIDATISGDGSIEIEFNHAVPGFPLRSCVFTPEVLHRLAAQYGEIPPDAATEFPGVPMVEEDDLFEDDEPGEDDTPPEVEPLDEGENGVAHGHGIRPPRRVIDVEPTAPTETEEPDEDE